VKLVIFDCDGVLVDSEPISNRELALAINRLGLEISTAEATQQFKGLTLAQVVAGVEAQLGRPTPDGWLEQYEHERAETFRRELREVPGAAAAVESVRAMGLDVCVASQGAVAKMELTLGVTGLDRVLGGASLFSARMVERPKPFPDLFQHAASSMGVATEHCLVIEDTTLGVTAARAAGMQVLGYAADSDPEELAGAGATVFTDMVELPGLIEERSRP
jgi:beta-phosphoglucomutase-like phosphatase (HAD superfamily)